MTEQTELGNDIEERERLEEEEQQQVSDETLVEEPPTTALVESGPSRLLEMAVQQDLDIDKLERLMAMQERWNEQQAKKAFYDALAQFQRIVPTMEKSEKVDFTSKKSGIHVRYSHASLAGIKKQIQESLSNCGFSYRWEIADKEKEIEVTYILTHISGHSEKTTMTAPADTSGLKNPVQEKASTVTYLQRYTKIAGLGLMTADMDDDGRQGRTGSPAPEEAAKDLPTVPEGTDIKAPKPETTGKTDFEKQGQLYGYLCEITGVDGTKVLSEEQTKKLSDELVELTTFESEGEKVAGEKSLKNLKGQRLNVAIGKAKAKLGHATPKDELLKLLQTPSLLKVLEAATINAMVKEAKGKNFKEEDCKKQILVVNGFIADAEKEQQ